VRTLRDTFSNPDQGLLPRESDDPTRYRRGYERGEYVLASLGPGELRAPLLAPLPGAYGDLAISVDARLVGDTAGRTLMVVCHDQGAMGGAGYGLLVSPGQGQFAVARWAELAGGDRLRHRGRGVVARTADDRGDHQRDEAADQ
jgi:hypothetical protein